jgi:hypothetical protein
LMNSSASWTSRSAASPLLTTRRILKLVRES